VVERGRLASIAREGGREGTTEVVVFDRRLGTIFAFAMGIRIEKVEFPVHARRVPAQLSIDTQRTGTHFRLEFCFAFHKCAGVCFHAFSWLVELSGG
jgi:hypothetical protein